MEIIKITGNEMRKMIPFWADSQETLIWSAIQGCMGSVWTDSLERPSASRIILGDFCFFAGEPNRMLVSKKPSDRDSNFMIMVPENEDWADMIERQFGEGARKVTRYALRKEPDIFDYDALQTIVDSLDPRFEMKLIDEMLFSRCLETDLTKFFCCEFQSYEEYREHGLGVLLLEGDKILAGASSYSYYTKGIEIEIDTDENYRSQGLATAVAAKLILECKKRDLYPSWDAQNKISLSLAEKLGYHFSHEYIAYEINNF